MSKTIAEVLEMAGGVELVELRVIDLPGSWQHFTMPVHRLTETFSRAASRSTVPPSAAFRRSTSDMLFKPDPDTAFIDPTAEISTLVLSCNVFDPLSYEPYTRDPRYVARKAEEYLKSTGIADTVYFAPEPEFFVFDGVRYASGTNEAFYSIDSEEAWWESGRSDRKNFGGQISPKRGYFPVPPTDTRCEEVPDALAVRPDRVLLPADVKPMDDEPLGGERDGESTFAAVNGAVGTLRGRAGKKQGGSESDHNEAAQAETG